MDGVGRAAADPSAYAGQARARCPGVAHLKLAARSWSRNHRRHRRRRTCQRAWRRDSGLPGSHQLSDPCGHVPDMRATSPSTLGDAANISSRLSPMSQEAHSKKTQTNPSVDSGCRKAHTLPVLRFAIPIRESLKLWYQGDLHPVEPTSGSGLAVRPHRSRIPSFVAWHPTSIGIRRRSYSICKEHMGACYKR